MAVVMIARYCFPAAGGYVRDILLCKTIESRLIDIGQEEKLILSRFIEDKKAILDLDSASLAVDWLERNKCMATHPTTGLSSRFRTGPEIFCPKIQIGCDRGSCG